MTPEPFASAVIRRDADHVGRAYDDWLVHRSRNRRWEVPVAAGGALVFSLVAWLTGSTLVWLLAALAGADLVWSSTHRARHIRRVLRSHGVGSRWVIAFRPDGVRFGEGDEAFTWSWGGLAGSPATRTGLFLKFRPDAEESIYVPRDRVEPAEAWDRIVGELAAVSEAREALGEAPPDAQARAELERIPAWSRLARVWDDFAVLPAVGWPQILPGLLPGLDLPGRTGALDLACGTGALLPTLAELFDEVVGLDRSPAMLERARGRCADLATVSYVEASFVDFALGRRFELVTCAFDSINYATDRDQLTAVLRRVAEHLVPGGVFCFDSLGAAAMSDHASPIAGREDRAWLLSGQAGRGDCVVFEDQVEIHDRAPVDHDDVMAALQAAGLELERRLDGSDSRLVAEDRAYWVLRKPADPGA